MCQATVGVMSELYILSCSGMRADTGQPDAAAQGSQQGSRPALAADREQPQRLCGNPLQMLGFRVWGPTTLLAAQGRQQGSRPALAADREQPQRLCAMPRQVLHQVRIS